MRRDSELPSSLRRAPASLVGARSHTAVGARATAGALALLAAAVLAAVLSACSATPHRGGAHDPSGRTRAPAEPTGLFIAARAAQPKLIPGPRPAGRAVRVRVGTRPSASSAPGDFLGLSFELRSLPLIARYGAPRGNLVALLRSLGPGVLRFGGVSADEQSAWVGPGDTLPSWASTAITPADFAGIAQLAHETDWRVLLTVNLGHYDPRAAAQEAAAARAALGSALIGIEIGNEPDRFAGKLLRGGGWGIAAYRTQAAAYRAAIEAAAPGTAIAGPDPATGTPGLPWLSAAAHTLHPALLTEHYYPLSNCGYKPTVGELLSPNLRRGAAAMLAKVQGIARQAHAPLRIDETNDISCEGRPGVSDTFASALWALDYIARALDAGVVGLNFHDLPTKAGSYSPLLAPSPAALATGALHAQPEWYALLAARELPGSRPLSVRLAGAAPGEISASAFRAPDGRLRLVLVDFDPPGSPPLAVRLQVSGARGARPTSNPTARTYTSGSILRLTASSPAATGDVRLGGRTVAPDGSWSRPSSLPAVYNRRGALSLQLAPSSATVVTLYPR